MTDIHITDEILEEVRWVREHPLKLDSDIIPDDALFPILDKVDQIDYYAFFAGSLKGPITRERLRSTLQDLRQAAQDIVTMIDNIL